MEGEKVLTGVNSHTHIIFPKEELPVTGGPEKTGGRINTLKSKAYLAEHTETQSKTRLKTS